jgi:hypothetical protein
MKRFAVYFLVFSVMLVTASGALAQQYVNPCEGDIAKFCGNLSPGKGYIADCLSQNEAQLSPECKSTHLAELSNVLRRAQQACKLDVVKFCPSEQMRSSVELMKCMWGFRTSLSPECNRDIFKALELLRY